MTTTRHTAPPVRDPRVLRLLNLSNFTSRADWIQAIYEHAMTCWEGSPLPLIAAIGTLDIIGCTDDSAGLVAARRLLELAGAANGPATLASRQAAGRAWRHGR